MLNKLEGEDGMKEKRHSLILQLIKDHDIDTQEELQMLLRKKGINVTQATISRDIKELRLVKALGDNGKYKYVASQSEKDSFSSKIIDIFADSVISVNYSHNIVVIKCPPGMAGGACAALDAMNWTGLVGTIAGDDTIIAVTTGLEASQSLTAELQALIDNRR